MRVCTYLPKKEVGLWRSNMDLGEEFEAAGGGRVGPPKPRPVAAATDS